MDETSLGSNETDAPRETMTMGDAAKMMGVSVAKVRKLCSLNERDPAKGLPFAWTSAGEPTEDVNGHTLRGHRRPYADAVRRFARANGTMPEVDAEHS
jgi:hypothetical protein